MSDEPEPVPDPLAMLDQAAAGLATRAQLLYGFFVALLRQGFTVDQAFDLTLNLYNPL